MRKTTKTDQTWINKIVRYVEEPPENIQGNPLNFRIHPKFQQDALSGQMDDIGWIAPIIINEVTNHCIDGHLRIKLAIERKLKTIPVIYVNLTEDEEKEAVISYDALTSMAVADKEKLDALLREMPAAMDARLTEMLGEMAKKEGLYPDKEIDEGPLPQIDRAVELQGKWATERGQIWEIESKTVIGKFHRIMCGDSTQSEAVAKLCQKETPFLMVTDPPYGVKYDPEWRKKLNPSAHYSLGVVVNDDKNDWFETWNLFKGDVAYVWHAVKGISQTEQDLEKAGFIMRNLIVWKKSTFVFGRGSYHQQFESCWYAVRKGKKSRWCGDRTQSTVWDIQNASGAGRANLEEKTPHSTEKPLECMRKPIRNHGTKGDIIFDPFVGSGTTMVAAENLGRLCYGMEISPAYVAVILERMAEMGLEPKLI